MVVWKILSKDGDGGILRLYRITEPNLGVETRAKTQGIAC